MFYKNDETLARDFTEFGNGSAMETIYRRHLMQVHALSSRYLSIREDAEEATSETFLRAFRALRSRQFRGESSLRTWLAKIAVNVCLERIRQPRLPTMAFDDLSDLPAPSGIEPTDISLALSSLPDAYRLTITLCDLEGYSAEEVSAIIGRTLTATRSLHYRARRALREALDQMDIEGEGRSRPLETK